MASGSVIRFIRQKDNEGKFSSPLYLGSETRFVAPIRGVNLNNLEEQLLIGCDTITEEWIDEQGNTKIHIEFHNDERAFGYYKLESTIFSQENIAGSDYYTGTSEQGVTTLFLPNSGEHRIADATWYMENDNTYSIDPNTGNINIAPPQELIIREDILYYINTEQLAQKIITKLTSRNITASGKIIKKEVVYNHLKGDSLDTN